MSQSSAVLCGRPEAPEAMDLLDFINGNRPPFAPAVTDSGRPSRSIPDAWEWSPAGWQVCYYPAAGKGGWKITWQPPAWDRWYFRDAACVGIEGLEDEPWPCLAGEADAAE